MLPVSDIQTRAKKFFQTKFIEIKYRAATHSYLYWLCRVWLQQERKVWRFVYFNNVIVTITVVGVNYFLFFLNS